MKNTIKNEKEVFNDFYEGLKKSGLNFFLIAGFYICPNPPLSYYTKAIAFSTYAVLILFHFIGYKTVSVSSDDLHQVTETLCYCSIIIPMFIGMLTIHIKKPLVEKLFRFVKEDFFKYEVQEDIEFADLALKDNLRRLQRLQMYYAYFIGVTVILWGLIAPPLEKYFDDGSNVKNPSIMYNLPVNLWVPFDPNITWLYYVHYSLQLYVGYMLFVIILAYDISFVCFCLQIITQVKILCHSILNIENRAVSLVEKNYRSSKFKHLEYSNKILVTMKDGEYGDPIFQKYLHRCFKENILHLEKIET